MSIQRTNDTMTSEKWLSTTRLVPYYFSDHHFSDVFFLLVPPTAEWEDPSLMLFVGSLHSLRFSSSSPIAVP
jgi:hypothetical protein